MGHPSDPSEWRGTRLGDTGLVHGDSSRYEARLNALTGTWYFEKNGTEYPRASGPHTYWVGQTGRQVQWTGEVRGSETDMPGRETSKVKFRNCQYHDGSHWRDTVMNSPGHKILTDDDEYGIEPVMSTGFNIWDKNRQSGD